MTRKRGRLRLPKLSSGSDFLVILMVVGVMFSLFYAFNYMSIPDLTASLGGWTFDIFGGLLVTIFGVFTVFSARDSPAIVGAFAVLGVGLAVLTQQALTASMIDATFLGGLTIDQFQAVVIILAFLFGLVVYLGGRKR